MSTESPMTMRPGACPEPEQLAEYMDGVLPPELRPVVERHLIECADCRDIVGDGVPMAETPAAVSPFRVQRNRKRPLLAAGVVLAAAAAVVFAVRVTMTDRENDGIALLRGAVGQTRPFDGRLTGGFPYRPLEPVTRSVEQPTPSTDLRIAAASIEKQAHASATAANLHAFGDAQLLTRDLDGAIRLLEQAAALAPSDGRILVDLAAAYVSRGRQQNAPADYEHALAALDKAGDAGSALEASFNRALALEGLGRRSEARDAWQRYLAADAQSGWASEARAHLAALDR